MSTPFSPTGVEDFGVYEVYDIVDRGEDERGHIMYRVKWDGYVDPRSDTWEYEQQLAMDGQEGLMDLCDQYLEWKVQGNDEDGEIVRTRRQFRKGLGAVLFASDAKRMCFFNSIQLIGKLLGVEIDTDKFQAKYPNGVPLPKIRSFFSVYSILKVHGTSTKKWRKGNYIEILF